MKILMVLGKPWNRQLGGSRIQLELAEHMRARGHVVDKFSWEDAFPTGLALPRLRSGQLAFPSVAARHIRAIGGDYDVIDALEGFLPFGRAQLGTRAALICRSLGLWANFAGFARWSQQRWPDRDTRGRWFMRPLHDLQTARSIANADQQSRAADLVIVPVQSERATLSRRLGIGDKVRVVPFGLDDERLRRFETCAAPPEVRLKSQTVAVVGSWHVRKGSRDLPDIVDEVRKSCPTVSFLLVGTGVSEARIRPNFSAGAQKHLTVIPRFESAGLPALLARVTVSALPSYMEGFGFAIIEGLAAGAPAVAYRVPGPMDLLESRPCGHLVNPGDTMAFAASIVRILRLPAGEYIAASAIARREAETYRWTEIAERTLRIYGSCR